MPILQQLYKRIYDKKDYLRNYSQLIAGNNGSVAPLVFSNISDLNRQENILRLQRVSLETIQFIKDTNRDLKKGKFVVDKPNYHFTKEQLQKDVNQPDFPRNAKNKAKEIFETQFSYYLERELAIRYFQYLLSDENSQTIINRIEETSWLLEKLSTQGWENFKLEGLNKGKLGDFNKKIEELMKEQESLKLKFIEESYPSACSIKGEEAEWKKCKKKFDLYSKGDFIFWLFVASLVCTVLPAAIAGGGILSAALGGANAEAVVLFIQLFPWAWLQYPAMATAITIVPGLTQRYYRNESKEALEKAGMELSEAQSNNVAYEQKQQIKPNDNSLAQQQVTIITPVFSSQVGLASQTIPTNSIVN